MHPQPLFTIFGRPVYLYGICIAIGILACFAFLMFTMKIKKFNEASSDAVVLIGIFGTGIGFFSGFLFQAIYGLIDTGTFSFDGMTFIGGLIGGVVGFLGIWNLYMYVIRPSTKIKWLSAEMNATLTDALPFIPIGIVIAHAFGRLGCFFGGCCYGKAAEWGLHCAKDFSNGYIIDPGAVIPTQLFEMAFLFILAAVMAVLYFKFKFNYNFSVYLISYGIWRFCIEFLRDDYRGKLVGNISPSQFWSILMVILGIGYVFAQYYLFSKLMKHPENTPAPVAATASEVAPDQSDNATGSNEEATQEIKNKKESKMPKVVVYSDGDEKNADAETRAVIEDSERIIKETEDFLSEVEKNTDGDGSGTIKAQKVSDGGTIITVGTDTAHLTVKLRAPDKKNSGKKSDKQSDKSDKQSDKNSDKQSDKKSDE